jgi:hypothetical protein
MSPKKQIRGSVNEMIEFLQQKGLKAYNEIVEICQKPDLLFSNDPNQLDSEARQNMRSIQSFNRLLHKNRISVHEVSIALTYIERSMEDYLRRFYNEKSFLFYVWPDALVPAIRFSVVSDFNDRLPFDCILNVTHDIKALIEEYKAAAAFNGVPILEHEEQIEGKDDEYNGIRLTVYVRTIQV